MVHALPLATTLAVVLLCSPKIRWSVVLAGYLDISVGVKADSLLAWITLGSEGFQAHKTAAQSFVASNLGVYSQFLSSPSITFLRGILGNIPANLLAASSYIGDGLLIAAAVIVCLVVVQAITVRKVLYKRELFHIMLAFAAASPAVVVWWSGMPSAPTRFLTSVAPIGVVSLAAAVAAALASGSTTRRTAMMLGVGASLIYSSSQVVQRGVFDSKIGEAIREEQRDVAHVIRSKSVREKKKPLCGEGWWYPHEILFLTGSPKTVSCGADRALGVVIPKHIFPAAIASQLISERCEKTFSGTYYDLAYCARVGGE